MLCSEQDRIRMFPDMNKIKSLHTMAAGDSFVYLGDFESYCMILLEYLTLDIPLIVQKRIEHLKLHILNHSL